MKSTNFLSIILLGMISLGAMAQTTDLARAEYLYLPFSKSKNSIGRYRALIQVPIPLDKDKNNLLVVGLEYRFVDIEIKDEEDVAVFNDHLVSSVQQMNAYLGYVWRGSEQWRFGVKGGVKLESDLGGKPINDDFIYEVAVYAVNDIKQNIDSNKPHRLILGLQYSNVPGRWYPLPLINYFKEFRPNWTYTLGVPKTNIRYFLNDRHKDALHAFATIDNVYANIQQNFALQPDSEGSDEKVAASIEETIVLLGLGYEHFFTKHFLFYTYVAHSVYNDFRLQDRDGNKIYKINTANSPYFRVGLKFKY